MQTTHDESQAHEAAPARQSTPKINTLTNAREAFSAYIEDAHSAEETAREFMHTGSRLAGYTATIEERQEIYGRYFAQIERHLERDGRDLSLREKREDAVDKTLEDMREAWQSVRRQRAEIRELAEQAELRDLSLQTTDAPPRRAALPGTTEHAAQTFQSFLRDRSEANEKAHLIISNAKILTRELVDDANRGDTRMRERFFQDYLGASSKAFADTQSRVPVERRFTELIVRSVTHDPSNDGERSIEEKRERLDRVLEQLEQDALISRSSPAARRAHLEAESYRHSTDDARSLYEPPEDRTRAEHADYLNRTNQFARDMYERGASVYGDVLIVPIEAHGNRAPKDDVRIGTVEHAINNFRSFVKDEKELVEKAQEFVALGQTIAGRTADGSSRLSIFQNFYKEVSHEVAEETFEGRDGSRVNFQINGKRRSTDAQKTQLDHTLERMREMASAMKEMEWKTEKGEFIEIGEWEESLSNPTYDREEMIGGREDMNDGRDSHQPTEREEEDRDKGGNFAASEHESVRLDGLPPRTPSELSPNTTYRVRAFLIPQVDRQLESGAHPSEIIRGLNTSQRLENGRAQDVLVSEPLSKRAPETNQEHPVSREEELRGLYTLRLLAADSGEKANAVASIDDQINRRQPSPEERADALATIGARIGVTLHSERERLTTYEQLEKTSVQLDERRERHQREVRQTLVWKEATREADEVRRDSLLDARIELIRGNTGAYSRRGERGQVRDLSRYHELTGEAPPASGFMLALDAGEKRVSESKTKLRELLATPNLDRDQADVKARLAIAEHGFRAATGEDITSSAEARRAVEPYLKGLERIAVRAAQEEADMRGAPLPAHVLPSERKDRAGETSHPIHIALSGRNTVRLPLDNFNEYQILSRTAANKTGDKDADINSKVEIATGTYRSLYGMEISGHTPDRDAAYNYVKEYIRFRLQDEGTRMRNTSRLYRDFIERLDGVRSPDELRREANSIRQENYDREKHPEKYGRETETARRNHAQTKKPLSQSEMNKLFLALAPDHYTDEMRRFRLERAGTGRDREERLRGLESGRTEPSPSLSKLLTEFDRARNWNDVRYYIVQLLNAPEKLPINLPRFSRVNLHAEHQNLAPAERDFLFNTVQERREELKRDIPARIQERTAKGVQEQARSQHSGRSIEARTEAKHPAQLREESVPRDSASFRAYVAASTWREAELLSAAAQTLPRNSDDSKRLPFLPTDDRSTVVVGISDRNLATAATILREFRTPHIKVTSIQLAKSNDLEKRQLGEIISTFQTLEHERLADGKVQYKITVPERSEIKRDEWEALLRHMQPRLGTENAGRESLALAAVRGDLRQQALKEAWSDVTPRELRHLETIVDAPPVILSKALDVESEIKSVDVLQSRARLADNVLRETIEAVADRVQRRLKEQNISLAEERAHVIQLTTSILRGERVAHPNIQSPNMTGYMQEELEQARKTIAGVVTPLDTKRFTEINAYAVQTKNEYLASFRRIDERMHDLSKVREPSREVPMEDRERATIKEREKQSSSFLRYNAAVREREAPALATEVRQLLAEPKTDVRAQLAGLEQTGASRVSDLVPDNRRSEIRREASEQAWWTLMPPEMLNTQEQQDRVIAPGIERAAIRVSETISNAELVGRGIDRTRTEQSTERGNMAGADDTLLRAFNEIDRAQQALSETRANVASVQRQQLFSKIRVGMEREVGGYLKGVLHEHGEAAFLPGKTQVHHTEMAANIMKEAFTKYGVRPEQLNLSDHRLEQIAESIVTGLPRELDDNRERSNRILQQQRAEQEQATMRVENVLNRMETGEQGARQPSEMERAFGQQHGDDGTLNLDEQFVTEKVSNRIDRTQETLPATLTDNSPNQTRQTHSQQSFDRATDVVMHKEHVHQHSR